MAAERPNVLFITLDDMNFDSVGVYGSKVPDTTPNLDQLAAGGFRFDHAHVTIAICQPTRAVWMTGRYPHTNGALGFDQINDDVPTLPETLRANGFYTGILGKTSHVIPSRTKAFEYSRGSDEMMRGRSQERYAQYTAEFLKVAKRTGRPFFLMVNANDPHHPFDNRKPASEREVSDAPVMERTYNGDFPAPSRIYQPDEVVVPGFVPDLPEVREEMAQYYSSVRRADDVVGRVLSELMSAGFADNTVVMLKSDHGIALPFAKTNVWRHSTRTPWIIRWPGVLEPGSVDTEHLVSGIDFAPTVLDILGIEAMAGMNGQSILPLLVDKEQTDRQFVFTQMNRTVAKTDYVMRSVQSKRFGLIWNAWSDGETEFDNAPAIRSMTWAAMTAAAESDPMIARRVQHFLYRVPFEFYDYENDPHGLNNLIDNPAFGDLIETYRNKLVEDMRSTGDFALQQWQ